MTERTTDSEDFDDYTDEHRDKEPVRVPPGAETMTPDVAEAPEQEPPD